MDQIFSARLDPFIGLNELIYGLWPILTCPIATLLLISFKKSQLVRQDTSARGTRKALSTDLLYEVIRQSRQHKQTLVHHAG